MSDKPDRGCLSVFVEVEMNRINCALDKEALEAVIEANSATLSGSFGVDRVDLNDCLAPVLWQWIVGGSAILAFVVGIFAGGCIVSKITSGSTCLQGIHIF